MSALDDLISSSEGLSIAPAEAVAMTPASHVTTFVDMCFGFVGQGIKFCLNTACETTSHTQDKFVVQPGALYIRHGGNKAFCSPCLSPGGLLKNRRRS
eukprot:scaffold26488_cov57-Attheya_sp.AAC.2